jgi:quercetin dioxygenase-like cupin family protein
MDPLHNLSEQGLTMKPIKTFKVFGETVEILVTSEATNNSFCMLVHTAPPGGGPPPHLHRFEDEIFTVVEGEFELFDGAQWNKLAPGEHAHTVRNRPHAFRNCGKTEGKMHIVAVDGRLDKYLEAISPLDIPKDMPQLLEISEEYGISFLTP